MWRWFGRLMLAILVCTSIWVMWVLRPIPATQQAASTLIVLGAAQYNGRPSPMFKTRLDHALHLYRKQHIRQIIVTGGIGKGDIYSEGNIGRRYLIKHGVPAGMVSAERASYSTWENLQNSKSLLANPKTPITLVTDQIHAPRALAMAQKLGFNANISPSPLAVDNEYTRKYQRREQLLLLAFAILGKAF